MKTLIYIFLIVFSLPGLAQKQTAIIKETERFEFHSNFWMNLHHFLYQQAKGSQVAHLEEDGNILLNIGEDAIFEALSDDERGVLNEAVEYYKKHLIKKKLLFDLGDLRVWIQKQDAGTSIRDTTFTMAYSKILNDFSGVYKKRFWEAHDKQNRKVLEKHFSTIKELEIYITDRLQKLVGYKWPDSKVRIDLTAYANYAGGYTQSRPTFNTIISTLDPFSEGPAFIETVFHEGAHILFSRDSEFRSHIYLISKEMELKFPRNLWHASQFYLCGRLVQDELKKNGVNYQLTMEVKNIFSNYNTNEFRSILEGYLNSETNMEKTVRALLTNLKGK